MTDVDRIAQQIIGQATQQAPNPLQRFEIALEAMDEGLLRLGEGMQRMGQGLDMAHFKILIALEILMDKGIVTKEEVEGHYKQQVQTKLDEIREAHRIQMEEQMAQAQAKIEGNAGVKTRDHEPPEGGCCGACKHDEEPEEDKHSDIVLPSEKGGKVIFK